MRVANIIEEGRWGGPQKRITAVATELRRHWHIETVVVLPTADSERFCSQLSSSGIPYLPIKLTALGKRWKVLFSYAFLFPYEIALLCRAISRQNIDLLHVSGGAWQVKGAIAGWFLRIPVLWHLNDTLMPTVVVALFRLLAARLASAFIVAGHRVKTVYLQGGRVLNGRPVFLVPAPVDTTVNDPDIVRPDAEILAFRGTRVVTVANINPIKGLESLIDAAEMVRASGEDYSFIVVGPVYPSQQKYFQRLVNRVRQKGLEGYFHFIGAKEDVPAVLRAASIFVCPSIAEASPMAVWEAMSMKCPVVCTDVGDVAHYVRSDETGYLVPVGDPAALAAAICKLAANPELRSRLGKKARQVALEEVDVKIVAKLTADSYTKTLSRR